MKKFRYILALVLALTMLMASPLNALAATHNVSDAEGFMEAFADEDKEVIINMEKDIVLNDVVVAGEGQNYTVNGDGNTLSAITIDGNGTVEINADVTGAEIEHAVGDDTWTEDTNALTVVGGAQVTVNGDVTAEGSAAVWVDDREWEDVLDDDGNVIGQTEKNLGASVTVNGDVTGGGDGYYMDNAAVSVQGGEVTVNGNVSGQDAEGYGAAGDAIYAGGNAEVTVDGNVSGGNGSLTEEEMEDAWNYSDGGTGITADGEATVTVTGDVSGGDGMGTYAWAGDGIVANGEAAVTVGGDVTGGDVIANPEVDAEEETNDDGTTDVFSSEAGDAIVADYGATVTVDGNATGGSTNGESGNGGNAIVAESYMMSYTGEAGSVTVEGTVSGGEGGENGADGAAVYYDGPDMSQEDIKEEDMDIGAILETPTDELSENQKETLAQAFSSMLVNGDLTGEELAALDADNADAYAELDEELEKFFEEENIPAEEAEDIRNWEYVNLFMSNLEEELQKQIEAEALTEEEAEALREETYLNLFKELVADEATSYNALHLLMGGYADITVGNVAEDSVYANSFLGAGVAAEYTKVNVTETASNGNPNTGESYSIVLFGMMAMAAMLGFVVVLNKRKETV